MELSKVKHIIDAYFAKITAEDLYHILTKEYGLKELDSFDDSLFDEESYTNFDEESYTNKESLSSFDFYNHIIEYASINNNEYTNQIINYDTPVGFVIVDKNKTKKLERTLPTAA